MLTVKYSARPSAVQDLPWRHDTLCHSLVWAVPQEVEAPVASTPKTQGPGSAIVELAPEAAAAVST